MTRGWMIAIASLVTVALIAGIIVVANLDDANLAQPSPSPSGPDEGPDVVGVGLDDPTADIVWLTEQGFFVPGEDGDDRPDRLVDRALLAVVWARIRELPVGPCTGDAPVADVDANRDDCSAIANAYARNVVGSENSDAFRPDHRLTRAELARLLYLDSHPTGRVDACAGEPGFADVSATAPECESVQWVVGAGLPAIIEAIDDATFAPSDNVELSIFASAVKRYYELFVDTDIEFDYEVEEGTLVLDPSDIVTSERRVVSEAKFLPDRTVVSPEIAEWTVVLSPGADRAPSGAGIFLLPGAETTPEGLAGQISNVIENSDGTALITVQQVSLNLVFKRLEVSGVFVSEDAGADSGVAPGRTSAPASLAPMLGAQPGYCQNKDSKGNLSSSLGVDKGLPFLLPTLAVPAERTRVDIVLGNLFVEPYVHVTTYMEVGLSLYVPTGITVSCSMDLLLRAAPVPIPPPVSLGVMPYMELGIEVDSGDPSVPLVKATGYLTFQLHADPPLFLFDKKVGQSLSISPTSKATVFAAIGLQVQVGLLGVAGMYFSAAVKAWFGAELQGGAGQGSKICYVNGLDLVFSAGVFLDLLVYTWQQVLASQAYPIISNPKVCLTYVAPPKEGKETKPPTTNPPGNQGGSGGSGSGGGSTTTPPKPKTLEEIRDEAMDIALEARAIAEFAEQQADEAQQAAAIAEATAAGDPIATSSAQHAAAAAQEAGEAAAEAREAADEAYAAAVAAATKGQADAALLLAQAALAYSEAAAAAVRAAAAAADAILEVKLPITHKDATAPTITIAAGDVWSLGPGDIHVFGDPSRTPYRWPAKVPVVPDVDDVVIGGSGAFLLGDNGTVWTWAFGSTPVQVPGLSDIEKLWACDFQMYAQDESGTFYAWGEHNGLDQIVPVAGASGTVAPTEVVEFSHVDQLDCESGVSSVRTASGDVWEWGEYANYIFPDPFGPQLLPRKVPLALPATDVSVSLVSSCAVLSDTRVWCWRQFMGGVALSDPYDTTYGNHWNHYTSPSPIHALSDVVDVHVGLNAWFAITSDGSLYSWGLNSDSLLGQGSHYSVLYPVRVEGLPPVTSIKSGQQGHHWTAVALAEDGTVWAWGDNGSGGVGDGTSVDRVAPKQVPRLSEVVEVDFRFSGHIYALDENGTLWYWGDSFLLEDLGYDFDADVPYGAFLRPVAITHFDNVGGFAFGPAQLMVWSH